ncbi:TetR/AcrR family transcriptional regulator [Paenibacillus sp. Z6-24]
MANKSKKEQIIRVASELFNQQGIRGTGVDQVVAESQVAKMTLYNHFPSKDELVLSYLKRQAEEWMGWFKSSIDNRGGTPQARLLTVYDVLGEWFAEPNFTGCAFIKAASEFSDSSHPYHKASHQYKSYLREYIAELTAQCDFQQPTTVSNTLYLLLEGAITANMLETDRESAMHAREAAEILIQRFSKTS